MIKNTEQLPISRLLPTGKSRLKIQAAPPVISQVSPCSVKIAPCYLQRAKTQEILINPGFLNSERDNRGILAISPCISPCYCETLSETGSHVTACATIAGSGEASAPFFGPVRHPIPPRPACRARHSA